MKYDAKTYVWNHVKHDRGCAEISTLLTSLAAVLGILEIRLEAMGSNRKRDRVASCRLALPPLVSWILARGRFTPSLDAVSSFVDFLCMQMRSCVWQDAQSQKPVGNAIYIYIYIYMLKISKDFYIGRAAIIRKHRKNTSGPTLRLMEHTRELSLQRDGNVNRSGNGRGMFRWLATMYH